MTGDRGDEVARHDREFHEATAHLYDEILLPIFGIYYDVAVGPGLDALTAAAPGREAVDVGCGTGGVTVELAARGFHVRGIDHSPAMLAHADRKLRERGFEDRVELVTGDVRRLPYEDASFDALTCQGVLHHLTDLEDCVRECARVLRPGGRFFIVEPCVGSTLLLRVWDGARERLAARRARRRRDEPDVDVEIPHHEEEEIDAGHLLALLDRHGLEGEPAYWTHFEGADRLPRFAARALVRAGSRPWRHRSGNLVYVTGRKRP